MTSEYKPEEEELSVGRARHSRAGSLKLQKPHISGGSRKGYVPQAIVKVAGWANAPSSVKRMLDYVARTADKDERELVSLETEDGVERHGQGEVNEISAEWRGDFEDKKRNRGSRLAVHLVLSAKAELKKSNIEKTLQAARRTVEKHFGEKGYKYALGVHQDGKSPHVHVVINSISPNKDVSKLRLNPKDLLEVRKTFADELTREGLKHVATREPKRSKARNSKMKADRPNTLAKVEAVIKKLKKEQRQFERQMGRKEPKVDAFRFRRQQMKALDTMRTQVKEDSTLKKEDRMKAFNQLRHFRREIERKGIDESKELKATVNHFEGRLQKWTKEYKQVQNDNKGRAKDVLKAGESLQSEIDQFCRVDLHQVRLPADEKKQAFKQLRSKGLEIKKCCELSKGRER